MKKKFLWPLLCGFIMVFFINSVSILAGEPLRQRLIILADMGNEPDEEQQMAHMLMCSNEFEIEGLIAVTGKYLHPDREDPYRQVVHPELFTKLINAYAEVLENLKVHADGWPDPDYLHSITVSGQKGYGIEDTGEGKSSPGSDLLLRVFEKEDPRPVWIVVNAGSNTLAQALLDYREIHSATEMDRVVAKLRVFENGAQDNSGAWICSEFPKIHWIRSNYQTYAYGGPGGIDGDIHSSEFDKLGPWFWKPYEYSGKGQNDWLKEHVMEDHGALGEVFPERVWGGNHAFMEGGGTIPWIGLVNRGLFDIDHPHWGGWGGRFSQKKVACFWSRHGEVRVDEEKVSPFYVYREVSDTWVNPVSGEEISGEYVPVWRWREAMYNDFMCRMDWSLESYDHANHHPIAAVGSDVGDEIIRLKALPGEVVKLDAGMSSDPDEDSFQVSWWQYMEAGTYPGVVHMARSNDTQVEVYIPSGAAGFQIHVILEVRDENPIGFLFDYRRIVIDVDEIYNHLHLFRHMN